jgi:hypothetical protein
MATPAAERPKAIRPKTTMGRHSNLSAGLHEQRSAFAAKRQKADGSLSTNIGHSAQRSFGSGMGALRPPQYKQITRFGAVRAKYDRIERL